MFPMVLHVMSTCLYVCLLAVDSWAGYEHSSFCGQQFVLERGEYPHWESWSGSNAYHIERMMSFRPICSAVSFCFPLQSEKALNLTHQIDSLGITTLVSPVSSIQSDLCQLLVADKSRLLCSVISCIRIWTFCWIRRIWPKFCYLN